MKEIGFQIEILTNLKCVNFLDITFNLDRNSYHPYRKPNDNLSYINILSNHPPQIIKQLPTTINNRLSNNSSNEQLFNQNKSGYEEALKQSGYKNISLTYQTTTSPKKQKRRRRKIIWFNPPFNKSVSTNVAKKFLSLIDKHFPPSSKLNKIFNRNTVKVSYSCTENMEKIIKGHNNNINATATDPLKACNCNNKASCPLDGKCRSTNVIYKCTVSAPNKNDKVYIGLTEGEFKSRFYTHKQSFTKKKYAKSTSLSKYIWELKENNINPSLSWTIMKTAKTYSNITKRCNLCLQEKFEILYYKNQNELLNNKSEIISKCRHENKFLMANYKSKD